MRFKRICAPCFSNLARSPGPKHPVFRLLRNGRFNNLEYGAYAPGVPDVFIDDAQFKALWLDPRRSYIVAEQKVVPNLEAIVGTDLLNLVAASGGKVVLTNHPMSISRAEAPKAVAMF